MDLEEKAAWRVEHLGIRRENFKAYSALKLGSISEEETRAFFGIQGL
jgi:hypothetical protein